MKGNDDDVKDKKFFLAHLETSEVADIVGNACTDIVMEELRKGTFSLNDAILVLHKDDTNSNGERQEVLTLVDYAIRKEVYKTAVALIKAGAPIIPHIEHDDDRAKKAPGIGVYSTLGGALHARANDVVCALLEHRGAEIDVTKQAVANCTSNVVIGGGGVALLNAMGRDPFAEMLLNLMYITGENFWPCMQTDCSALEFAVYSKNDAMVREMLRRQAVGFEDLSGVVKLSLKGYLSQSMTNILANGHAEACKRVDRAHSVAWANTMMEGVWPDFTHVLVPYILCTPPGEDFMREKEEGRASKKHKYGR